MIRFIGGPNDGDTYGGEPLEDESAIAIAQPPQLVVKDASDAPPTLEELKAAAATEFVYRFFQTSQEDAAFGGILVPDGWEPEQALLHVLENWGPRA